MSLVEKRRRSLSATLLPPPGDTRLLAASWMVKTVGSGIYLTTGALFFTRVAGFPVHQVATGMTVAGLLALLGAVPLGRAADHLGPRQVYTVLLAVQFAAMTSLALVRSFPVFLGTMFVFLLAEQGGSAARGALVATAAAPSERVRFRAYLRVITNIGVSIGAAASAFVIRADSHAGYTAILLVTALTYVAAALPLRWLHRVPDSRGVPTTPGPPASAWRVIGDGRYAVVTLMYGVLSIHEQILAFATPLWILHHTDGPPALVSAIVALNALLVILLQIRFSRGAESDRGAAALCRRSGLALLLACAIMPFTSGSGGWQATLLLLTFAVALTFGELWLSAGSFQLSFSLAREDMYGQYLGLFAMGRGLSTALAPVLLAALLLGDFPVAGWLALGGVFAAAGWVLSWVVRRSAPSPASA